MQLIDGKATAKAIKEEIRKEVDSLFQAGKRPPHLAAILVGHDGGSETYVAYKIKDCEEVGFRSSLIRFEEDVRKRFFWQRSGNLMRMMDWMALLFNCPSRIISMNRK